MKNFDNIKFLGTFRNYQQRVLDNSDKYLKNKKMHIVAAPGSGKTILGLELIRRLNAPCLVLSPTNTIKYQWGDRFASMFLENKADIDNYISYDLNDVKLITSITYQALHSAMSKLSYTDEDGNDCDYSNTDMLKLINDYGIQTICVDEAHHLQNEWQKALEAFINKLNNKVNIIALTATPPYDASEAEWERYINICGEIDEEIYVTELVKAKNLCPHQDYIYFNYPTKEEGLIFEKFKQNIINSFNDIKKLDFFNKIPSIFKKNLAKDESIIFKNIYDYINVFSLLKKLEIKFNENKIKKILKINEFLTDNQAYEDGLNFLLRNTIYLNSKEQEELVNIFKKYQLFENNKISFVNNSKIEKNLLLSMGKIESIINIVNCEHENLKNNLRLLILTDFIRKQTTSKIGTDELFKDISVVSIFENLRRKNKKLKMAVLSGTLVILPSNLEIEIKNLLKEKATRLTTKPYKNTEYSEYIFNLSNKEKVAIIGQLFEKGLVNIIVGTKSLLGEGWDSPCINTLIMASFVGSFMLSNQMRGRAIRVFKQDNNKTANIWHLVTLEPENINTNTSIECNEENSSDYKTLNRRFNCFVGPHYNENKIESGIERISILKNKYKKEDVDNINAQMQALSKDRKNLFDKWNVTKSGIMYMQSTIQRDKIPLKYGIFHTLPIALFYLLIAISCSTFLQQSTPYSIIKFTLSVVSVFTYILFALKIINCFNLCIPKLFIKNIAIKIKNTLEENNIISSDNQVKVFNDSKTKSINLVLISNNIKEQKIFLNAVSDFLSPIKDCRYILCKQIFNFNLYSLCFQAPKILSTNKELANNLCKNLQSLLQLKPIFISSKNKKILTVCQKYAYIKQNSAEITQKMITLD